MLTDKVEQSSTEGIYQEEEMKEHSRKSEKPRSISASSPNANTITDLNENTMDFHQEALTRTQLSELNKYAHSLVMANSLDEIYSLTVRAMRRTLGFEHASVMILHGNLLTVVAQHGYPTSLKIKLSLERKKGITVKVAKTGKPVLALDVSKEPLYVEALPGIRSELAVPIKAEGKVLGVLNVESKKLAAFNEEEKELLEILASHCAVAIFNLQRRGRLERKTRELAALMESSAEIVRIKDLNRRLKVICEAIRSVGWGRAAIALRDENFEVVNLATSGLTEEEVKNLRNRIRAGRIRCFEHLCSPEHKRFKIGEFYYYPWNDPWVRKHFHGVSEEVQSDSGRGIQSRIIPEKTIDWHPNDALIAPLKSPKGKIVGGLSIDDPVDRKRPTKESLAPLEVFLHLATVAIENARLISDLEKAQKQLKKYSLELEERVAERTRELRESQEKLLKAERLAAIGEVAAMVGHDLKNTLQSIENATYYLNNQLSRLSPSIPIPQKTMEMLQVIRDSVNYADGIIRDLQDFSATKKPILKKINIDALVKETLSQIEAPENVELITELGNLPEIQVDKDQIKRVFLNLAINGIQAMENGGTLKVSTKKTKGFVKISFKDTGVGMSKEKMKKLFTPFFTTKAKGMGMGLAICKKFVNAHGGSIEVESDVGEGSTFTVKLPIPQENGGENQ